MATETASSSAAVGGQFESRRCRSIADAADDWDRLVPRDLPHLRAGMLRAVEASGFLDNPAYLLLYQGDVPLAAAFAYTLPIDPMATAPAAVGHIVSRIRQRAPGFMWGSMRVCGPPISNASTGVYVSLELGEDERRAAMDQITRAVIDTATIDQTIFFRDYCEEDLNGHVRQLAGLGFFKVHPPPGTRLELPWENFDDYVSALRRKYRQKVRKDMKASEALDFELLDSFADVAPVTFRLYEKVLANADYVLEKLNERLFAAVSDFEQAKLLVARHKESGDILGTNLLLFGDGVMQNLFIGFDYETNNDYHTYFALVEHSLKAAIEHGCRQVFLGQDSYDFKSRLGALPFDLTAFMKHRIWPVHFLMRSSRERLFPPTEGIVRDVFTDGAK